MPTPFCSHRSVPPRCAGATHLHDAAPQTDWRCTNCNKLLGAFRGDRPHVRFTRSHEYLVSLPAQATCRGCGTLNEATAPRR